MSELKEPFSNVMVDMATKQGSPIKSYHIVVEYKKDIFNDVKYKDSMKSFLPEYAKPSWKDSIRMDELCYYAMTSTFYKYSDSLSDSINSGCGFYEYDNKTYRPDRKSLFQDDGVERVEMGLYKEGLNIEDFLKYFNENLPDIVKDKVKIISYRQVKSNPRKPKVECTDLVYDQFGILIEKGDLIAYPKGGDHNYYYVCKGVVTENTPKFVKLENGDMTKADKVIVIKPKNPEKKVSF